MTPKLPLIATIAIYFPTEFPLVSKIPIVIDYFLVSVWQ
nr:MAG TPA: hypothetical protein [Bacteriophage sp.]